MTSKDNSSGPDDQTLEKHVTQLKCRCGQAGNATWDIFQISDGRCPPPVLMEVSTGFYARVRKKDIRKTEVVCDVCDAIVAT